MRQATIDDAEVLYTVVNAAYAVENGDTGLAFKNTGRYSDVEQCVSEIAASLADSESSYVCLLSDDEDILGCVRLTWRLVGDEKAADIGPFAVGLLAQQRGAGTLLLDKAFEWAAEKGCSSLLIEVVNHRTDLFRPASHGFYGRRGFRLVGTAPCDEAHNCDESHLTRPSHFNLLRKRVARSSVPVAAATWPFGEPAAKEAERCMREDPHCEGLLALEKGLNVVELDPATGPYFVGKGGLPNAVGQVTLDAAVMRGSDCRLGSVAALQHCPRAVSVALQVLERSPHSMLVGNGADAFAAAQGFAKESIATEASDKAFEEYQSRKRDGVKDEEKPLKTDTLSAVALDGEGNVSAAVTTSGMSFKAEGRVGDSPVVGAGLYADAEAGACVATGDGDQIMRFCPSMQVVLAMGLGQTPDEACSGTIASIFRRMQRSGQPMFEMALLAMDTGGRVGAGSTFGLWRDHVTGQQWQGFPYAVAQGGVCEMRVCAGIREEELQAAGIARQPWSEQPKPAAAGGIFPTN